MADFIIIRYKIEMPISSFGICWQYAKVTVKGETANIKDIDRAEALRLIKKNGLTLAHSDKNGKIWDKNEEFKNHYEGFIKKHNYANRRAEGENADGDR